MIASFFKGKPRSKMCNLHTGCRKLGVVSENDIARKTRKKSYKDNVLKCLVFPSLLERCK